MHMICLVEFAPSGINRDNSDRNIQIPQFFLILDHIFFGELWLSVFLSSTWKLGIILHYLCKNEARNVQTCSFRNLEQLVDGFIQLVQATCNGSKCLNMQLDIGFKRPLSMHWDVYCVVLDVFPCFEGKHWWMIM